MQSIWTDERIELIKARWANGYSARQIANELGNGISRNAVLGKLLRLGCVSPNSPEKHKAKTKHQTYAALKSEIAKSPFVPRIVENKAPPVIGPESDFPPIGFCRYINDHPAIQTWHCCGQPVKGETPWCEFHFGIVRTSKKEKPETEILGEKLPLDELPMGKYMPKRISSRYKNGRMT